MSEQYGFDMGTAAGFDFGGQAGFKFSEPESQHSKDARERKRRHDAEDQARKKREREQKQEQERQQRERSRHTHAFESPWEVLGIPVTATAKEIRKAWAAAMEACHPDIGGSVADAQRINKAYEALKGGRK
jgi:DnaJ-domain-containing protein 1